MAEFVGHEPCPECAKRGRDRSGNNLGIWDDGHKFCFACRYHVPASTWEQLKSIRTEKEQDRGTTKSISLPDDFGYSLPNVAVDWLRKYQITNREIQKYGLGWSNDGKFLIKQNVWVRPILVIPFYGEQRDLLAWQGRNFGEEGPKYVTKGLREDVLPVVGLDKSQNFVVCVEDAVSAYKVGRQFPAMPLLGSDLSLDKARRLGKLFEGILLWLDYDKARESFKLASRLAPFTKFVKTIVTERDPKEYSDEEIVAFIAPAVDGV